MHRLARHDVEIFGLPLSVMNQLSTFGAVIYTEQGQNHITIRAGEDPERSQHDLYVGDI